MEHEANSLNSKVSWPRTTHCAAERMDVLVPQTRRHEATRYAGMSVEPLQAVANAPNLHVNEVFTLQKQ